MIECELCFHWCHSKCIGISAPVAKNYPFICPYCTRSLLQEVSSLRLVVDDLKEQLASIKQQDQPVNSDSSPTSPSTNLLGQNLSSDSTPPSQPSDYHPAKNQSHSSDRRFNLIVSGVGEQPAGTPRATCLREDSVEISSILSPLLPSFSDHSVRDCYRLGKYKPNSTRPLLVTMSRTSDVATILSNKSSLADRPHLRISPDLPPHLRKSRSILLKVRYDLISSGIERKNIRISSDSIFVNHVKRGSVINQVFKECAQSPEDVDASNSVSNPPSPPTDVADSPLMDHNLSSTSSTTD
uniref:Zinc finger PHD-type domain-containing protein n=1 Tax=Amphimedon queenslandica TaxID=400682 RepID=A0A1X7SS14_AMPQE